jgi:hypothetical protein
MVKAVVLVVETVDTATVQVQGLLIKDSMVEQKPQSQVVVAEAELGLLVHQGLQITGVVLVVLEFQAQ